MTKSELIKRIQKKPIKQDREMKNQTLLLEKYLSFADLCKTDKEFRKLCKSL